MDELWYQSSPRQRAVKQLCVCLQFYAGRSYVRPMHPSVGSSGLGTSCSPSPPKSVLSQSAPADVNTFTLMHSDTTPADSVGSIHVKLHSLKVTISGKKLNLLHISLMGTV